MAESVKCRECGASIEINGPITEDTMITCDDCGAEWDSNPNPRNDAIKEAKKKAVGDVKKLIHEELKKVARQNKNIKLP